MQRSIRLNRFLRQIKPREVCRSRSVAQSLPAPRSLPGSLLRRRLYRLHSDASNGTPTHGQGAICSVRCRQQKNERARGREGAIVRKLVFRSAHAMPTTAAMAEVLRERQRYFSSCPCRHWNDMHGNISCGESNNSGTPRFEGGLLGGRRTNPRWLARWKAR